MYVVRPDESVGAPSDSVSDIQWKMIDTILHDYTKVHPKEIRDILFENKAIRESMLNEYGSSKQGLRWGFRMPPALVRIIDRRFPDFLTNRSNIHNFMERYPAFRVCETV